MLYLKPTTQSKPHLAAFFIGDTQTITTSKIIAVIAPNRKTRPILQP